MKKLITLLVGAVLFSAMSLTSLNAADMKCGAGKCGAEMKKPACCEPKAPEMKKPACCEAKAAGRDCTCPKAIECTCKDKNNCTCGVAKKAAKAPKEAMKCGTGKCG